MKIAALPAPIAPGPGQPVKDLAGAGFADELGAVLGFAAPQEFGNVLFNDLADLRRNPGLAEIFLRDHVAGDLDLQAGRQTSQSSQA